MEKILYEYNLDWKNNYGTSITVYIIFAIFFLSVFIKYRKKKWSIAALLLSLVWFIIPLISVQVFLNQYKDISQKYKEGNYLVIEGYVEDYKAEPKKGHSPEIFNISGVKFQTSDYTCKLGYNKTKNSNGVITGLDNQYLRVYYIEDLSCGEDEVHRYIILKIIEVME